MKTGRAVGTVTRRDSRRTALLTQLKTTAPTWPISLKRFNRRYLQVDGRPLLLIYRARRLPDPLATATRLREEAFRLGVGEIFLCCVESFPDERGDPRAIGFDAAVEFQPDWSQLTKDLCTGPVRVLGPNGDIVRLARAFQDDSVCAVYDYAAVVDRMIAKPPA